MFWVDFIVIVILVLSFFGGVKDGAVKSFFALLVTIISIPLSGITYRLIATLLSFLPGTNWENFIGFFITLAIFSIILRLVFMLPRKIFQKIWRKGLLFRLLGGALSVFNAAIGFTLFSLVVIAFPIFDWLERWITGSGVLMSLANGLGFVPAMLPVIFQKMAPLINIIASA